MDTPVIEQKTTALTVIQRAAIALGASEHEKALIALAKKHAVITVIKDADSRDDCHSAYMELKNARVDLEGKGKDARDDATKFSKAVIAEENRLVNIISPEEKRLKAMRDEWDAAREAERKAEAEKERVRIETLASRVEAISQLASRMIGKTVAEIEAALHAQRKAPPGPDFQEFLPEALAAHVTAVKHLEVLLDGAKASAEAERRAAEDRAELARLRQAEADRLQKEADARAEAEALAETERREALKVQEQALKDAREKQETELATQRAEQARIEAEARQAREAEETRLAAERVALERQAAELTERQRLNAEAEAAQDAKVRAGATVLYAAIVKVRSIARPGSQEAEIAEKALFDTGLL